MDKPPDVLKDRQLGLGASEALGYCVKDPRKTPLELYLEKTGDAARPVVTDELPAPRLDWGNRLEPVVRDWLAEEIGTRIIPNPPRVVSH